MKTTKTITIDVQVWQRARLAYPSVSAKVESLLRASLDTPESVKETDDDKRIIQLEEEKSIAMAKAQEAEKELKELKQNAEERKRTTIQFDSSQ